MYVKKIKRNLGISDFLLLDGSFYRKLRRVGILRDNSVLVFNSVSFIL